jgi:hypothetical protein
MSVLQSAEFGKLEKVQLHAAKIVTLGLPIFFIQRILVSRNRVGILYVKDWEMSN